MTVLLLFIHAIVFFLLFFTIYLQLRFVICILYNKWMNECFDVLLGRIIVPAYNGHCPSA